eukprot:s2124_g4.t2
MPVQDRNLEANEANEANEHLKAIDLEVTTIPFLSDFQSLDKAMAMRFGVVGPGGPEPPMTVAASSSKTLKALKESAARALHFVHPSGNVWKPRHLFTETPSGNLRELQETSQVIEEKVLWVEPPWKAGSVLQQGLTSRSRWTWGARLYQSLSRLPCCLPLYRWRSTAAAAKGGRGAPRREQKVQKDPKRPTHFVSLRVGEDVQRAALKVQQELVGQADGNLRKDLERCLIPSGQFHLTLATLKLRTEEDVQVIREQLNQVSDLAGFHFKLKGLESFGQRVLFARACDDGSNGYAALCALHTRLADAFEICLPGLQLVQHKKSARQPSNHPTIQPSVPRLGTLPEAPQSPSALAMFADILELPGLVITAFTEYGRPIALSCSVQVVCLILLFILARAVKPGEKDKVTLADVWFSMFFFPLLAFAAVAASLELRHDVQSRWQGTCFWSELYLVLYVSRMMCHIVVQPLTEMPKSLLIMMTIHHLISMGCYILGLGYGRCHYWGCLDGCCEITTVFLNVLYLFNSPSEDGGKLKNHVPHWLVATNSVALWLAFLVFRLMLFPYWIYTFRQDMHQVPELTRVKKEAALSSETIETISTQEPTELTEPTAAELSQEKLSRFLTRVLRHDAKRLGLQMRSDGSVALKDLVALSFFRNHGFAEADVEREVKHNDKQRFSLWLENGIKRIRANQGHKMKEVVDSELLTPISSSKELPVCIHGTYMKRWHNKKKSYVDVWPAIKREGLKPMGRNHIHFVPHEVGSRTVISGMRQDCTVAIYLDVPKALAMGIKLFRSSNDVVLTRGNESGHIPTELFLRAVEIKTGRLLWPPEAGADIATEEEDCFQPHLTLAKTSRAHDGARIPESCWQALRTVELGVVTAESLELCRMKGDPQTGYYEVDHKVSFKRSQRG